MQKIIFALLKRQLKDYKFLATVIIVAAIMLGISSIAFTPIEISETQELNNTLEQEEFQNFKPFFIAYILMIMMPFLILITYGTDHYEKIQTHYYRYLITRISRSKIYFSFLASQVMAHNIVIGLSFIAVQYFSLRNYIEPTIIQDYNSFELFVIPLAYLLLITTLFVVSYTAINSNNNSKGFTLFITAIVVITIFTLPLSETLSNIAIYSNLPEFDEIILQNALKSMGIIISYIILFTTAGYYLFKRCEL